MRGPRGFTGATGPQGLTGDRGPQGEPGPQGCEGVEGPMGLTGLPGPNGPQGPEGPTGPMGPCGPTGEDGVPGADGTNGVDGQTPYIGENGNWWIGTTDTGVNAIGPTIAGNYETLVNAGPVTQDGLIYFPNGGFVQRGMSIDTTRKIITLDAAGYYRITFMAYAYATSGNPTIDIMLNGTTTLNFFQVSPTAGGTTLIDVVYPLQAGSTISFAVHNGDINFWENATNQIGGYLTIVGWGPLTTPTP